MPSTFTQLQMSQNCSRFRSAYALGTRGPIEPERVNTFAALPCSASIGELALGFRNKTAQAVKFTPSRTLAAGA